MYKLTVISIFVFGSLLNLTSVNSGEEDPGEIVVRVSKLMGYSSGSGEMQGLFTLNVTGGVDLERVEFFLDGQLIGEDQDLPFKMNLSTDAYSLENHTISARAFTKDGRTLNSNVLKVRFVSLAEGMQAALRIAGPLIGIVFVAILVSSVFPLVAGRRKTSRLPPGAPRKYGASGGTICPKCRRPFSLHVFRLNLGLNKLERCPYCGKWSLVRRVNPGELAAAEAAEVEQAGPQEENRKLEEAERLRRDLELSKYEDS